MGFPNSELLSNWPGCSGFFCGQERWWPLVLWVFECFFCSRPRKKYTVLVLDMSRDIVVSIDILGGGFEYFLFSSLLGEDFQFDEHIFQRG